MLRARSISTVGFIALAMFASSCASSEPSSAQTKYESSAEAVWLEPSPSLERQINLRALEVEVIKTKDDFVRLSDWFQGAGEPAYPKLLQMSGSSNQNARSFAMTVIAALKDPRLADPFKDAVDVNTLVQPNHRYEFARALLAMGDFDGVPYLIEGLEDPVPIKRALAHRALANATNTGIEFDANASEAERSESIQAWRAWWSEVSGDEMLDRP